MIYPWRQIGRLDKRLAKTALLKSTVYAFSPYNKQKLKEHLMKKHDKVFFKDLQRHLKSTEPSASQSTHPDIRGMIGRKCNIAWHRHSSDRRRAHGQGRSSQSPE
jgi:hypothetical protein